MKKFYLTKVYYALLISIPFIVSCNDEDDPLPVSKAGFEVQDENNLEKNIPVKFVNLSTNSASFMWDFGDGTFDSLSVAPEHVYEAAGSYDVTLTATTEDGQTSSETKSVEIKTRVLVAFSVANINFIKQNENDELVPWDEDGTGPDLIFIFGAQSATNENIIVTDTIDNVTPADLPLDWEFQQGNGLELTSELHDLVLLDADPEKTGDQQFDVMFGIEFDPVQYEFGIKNDDDTGLLQVSIGGFAIDLIVTFALQ